MNMEQPPFCARPLRCRYATRHPEVRRLCGPSQDTRKIGGEGLPTDYHAPVHAPVLAKPVTSHQLTEAVPPKWRSQGRWCTETRKLWGIFIWKDCCQRRGISFFPAGVILLIVPLVIRHVSSGDEPANAGGAASVIGTPRWPHHEFSSNDDETEAPS